MLKHSKQRDAIEQFLATRYDHPTAETVYMNLREEYPKLSLATVYRNLSLLAELGNIQKIPTGNGPDRFDGRPESHNHFLCDECGSMIDLQMNSIDHVDEIAAQTFDGVIKGHSILFYGICLECLKKEKEQKQKQNKPVGDS